MTEACSSLHDLRKVQSLFLSWWNSCQTSRGRHQISKAYSEWKGCMSTIKISPGKYNYFNIIILASTTHKILKTCASFSCSLLSPIFWDYLSSGEVFTGSRDQLEHKFCTSFSLLISLWEGSCTCLTFTGVVELL